MNPWEGKHMWIWYLDQSGDPEAIVEKAVALGLSGLIVKAFDGGTYWPQIEAIIEPAHAAGLVVGAWGYSYGTNPWGEGAAAKRAVASGADWLIIDAEAEYENSLGADRAESLGNVFRGMFPDTPSGYTSFGIAQYHPSFPWAQFSQWCDAVLPQVYWGDFEMSVDQALSESISGLQQYGKPIAPVGQTYGVVAPDDVTRFGELTENAGLPGISYWDWQEATVAMLEAVGDAPYRKEANVVNDWAKPSWDKAVAAGVLDGTNPQGTVTREMLAAVLDKCGLLEPVDPAGQSEIAKLQSAGIINSDHQADEVARFGTVAALLNRTQGR